MKPCPKCPFNRKVPPGALGGSPPTVYIGQAEGPYVIPCHEHLDYSDPLWRENAINTPQCAGAAIYRANIGLGTQLSERLLRLERNTELVFASPVEFLAHHGQSTTEEAASYLRTFPPQYWLEQQLARNNNIVY